eukprot:scaffold71_cov247-Pinguiococcus_pyrenoidosus.AAC.18
MEELANAHSSSAAAGFALCGPMCTAQRELLYLEGSNRLQLAARPSEACSVPLLANLLLLLSLPPTRVLYAT